MRLDDDDFFDKHESNQVLIRWIRSELELQGCQPGDRDRMAAEYQRSHPRVARLLLKAPVGLSGANLSPDEQFASRTFDEGQQATNVLVAESAARSFRPAPMNSSIALRAEDATGALVEAGQAKPISPLTISAPVFMSPRKTVAIVATTKELIKPGKAEAFINGGVRAGESNWATSAVAEDVAVLGYGTTSCADYAQSYKLDPEYWGDLFYSWAQGTMSGMNIMLSGQGLELTDLGAVSIESQERLIN